MNAAFFVIKEVWKKFEYPLFSKNELDMYQVLSRVPTVLVQGELSDLKKALGCMKKA